MKQLDNIGSFFRKLLLAERPVEEDWNIPSDTIWDDAFIHFPKEKKKDRKFFILLFGSILLLAIILHQLIQTSYKQSTSETHYSQPTSQTSIENTNLTSAALQTKNHHDIHKPSNPEQTDITKTTTEAPIQTQQESPVNSNNKNSIQNSSTEISVREWNKNQHQQEPFNFFNTSTIYTQDNRQLNPGLNSRLFDSNSTQQRSQLDHRADPVLHKPTAKNTMPTIFFHTVDPLSLQELDIDASSLETTPSRMILVNQDIYKWEVGVEFSQFPNKPNWIIEDLLDEDDMYTLDLNESGYNFTIAKKRNTRFSWSSGLLFSNLDYDLSIRETDIYDSDTPSEYLKKRIEDIISIGSISINDNSSDLAIEVLPSADLSRGDELIIDVQFPIKLKAYQLPILFNYHLYHQKWEWNLMTGISIDFIDIGIQDVDIQVLKNNDMIISPLEFNPISDQSIAGSLYVGGGLKYNITNRFNIGINYRIDLTETRLSKYSAGSYYRF